MVMCLVRVLSLVELEFVAVVLGCPQDDALPVVLLVGEQHLPLQAGRRMDGWTDGQMDGVNSANVRLVEKMKNTDGVPHPSKQKKPLSY
jgi:hypothetical protein